VLSRAVSADFYACECLCFGCACRRSARSAIADFFAVGSCWLVCSALVWCGCSSTFRRVTISSARSLRSFFSFCDRASTRPFVDARGPYGTSALGRDSPDTDKISSIVLRDSSSLHNREHAWPKDQVKGTHRAGREPQGFAHLKASESTPSQKSIGFLRHGVMDGIIEEPDAEDRATVGTDPSAA
jgi:hypothetical protein